MDQKRTLWITIAAGVFLLVVVGAALILYAPAAKKETQVAYNDSSNVWVSPSLPTLPGDSFSQGTASTSVGNTNPQNQNVSETDNNIAADSTSTEPLASSSDSQKTSPAQTNGITQTDNLTVIAKGTTNVYGVADTTTSYVPTTTTIDLNSLKYSNSNVTANNQVAQNAIEETAVKHAQTSVTPTKTTSTDKTETYVAPKKPTTKTTSNTKSTASTKKVVKTTAIKKATVEKIPDQFWIQVLSSSVKKNADEARTTLDSKKMPAEVFTYKDSKKTLYYRVRVGPYTTKSEAEYWKAKIEEIELFAKSGSYITNTSAPKK